MSDVKVCEEKIYTHDEAALIVDFFEEVLDKYGLKIPSPEDDERGEENDAKLYGSVYSELLDNVEEKLCEMLTRQASGSIVVRDEFSGRI